MSAPRLGIVLGCGSARGWAHIGVLQALAEQGFRPDVVTGASVGALVAAAAAAGRLDALDDWVRTLTQRDVWHLVDTTFRGGGVMTGNRLIGTIAEHIGDRSIETLPIRFGAVAADLYTGEEVWLREGPLMSAVRASSGFPGLFAPTWHEGRWLIDGGVVNPLPVSLCRALGAEIVIAVDLSRSFAQPGMRAERDHDPANKNHEGPRPGEETSSGPHDDGNTLASRWSALVDGLVQSFRSRRGEPGLFEVMSGALNIMQDQITHNRLAIEPADVVLRPDLASFQMMDFHRAAEAIEVGRAFVTASAARLAPLQHPG